MSQLRDWEDEPDLSTPEEAAAAERHKRAEEFRETQRRNAYATTLATPAGRAVLWELMAVAGLYHASYAGENTHAECLTTDADAYNLMRVEGAERSAVFEKMRGE